MLDFNHYIYLHLSFSFLLSSVVLKSFLTLIRDEINYRNFLKKLNVLNSEIECLATEGNNEKIYEALFNLLNSKP